MRGPSRNLAAEGHPNTTVHLRAEKLVGGGRALAHHDGATWMVGGALPGELVAVAPVRRRAGVVEAMTLEVLDDSHPARESDPCPHADACGGCDWPHVEPAAAAALKASAAAEAARAHPDLAGLIAAASIETSDLAYRRRARLHWDPETQRLGFFEARSWRVASIPSCRILSPRLMEALPVLAEALSRRCPHRVDVEWLEGTQPGDTVAALRPAREGPANVEPSWVPTAREVGSVVSGLHLLSGRGMPRTVWGAEQVTIQLPIPLRVPIGAFFQGNRHLLEPLFTRVAELAGPEPQPVFDLHAGVGFLAAAALSASERDVTLVEPHRPAAVAARKNLPQARVAVGRTAEAFLARSSHDLLAPEDRLPQEALVMTDPPRTGMTRTLRGRLADWMPRRILMLGCDPATWARDAAFLVANGYRRTNRNPGSAAGVVGRLTDQALMERG